MRALRLRESLDIPLPAPSTNRVRIIGGLWRRRADPLPAAEGLRPTPDRVRETLFNWLGQDLTGKRCLDLYTGTGALSLEAASRGAALAVAVDRNRALIDSLARHRPVLGANALELHVADARTLTSRANDAILRRDLPRPAVSRRPVGLAVAGVHRTARPGWLRLCRGRARRLRRPRDSWRGAATRRGKCIIIFSWNRRPRADPRATRARSHGETRCPDTGRAAEPPRGHSC